MSHSPTPWKVVDKCGIVANSTYLADIVSSNFTEEQDACNAAFIVKAVNAHDELVAALNELCIAYAGCNGEDHPSYEKARAALAKAGAL